LTRISVVHQAALGDTVLLMPLFRSLRQHFPGCAITLVTRSNFGQMLTMLGEVDAYASADDRDHTALFVAPEGDPAAPPAWADCDLLISAVSDGRDAWAQNAARSPARRRLFFQPRPPADYPGHVTAFHREQLVQQGLPLDEAKLPLPRSNPDGAVVIHPGSGGDAKCWPRERYLSLGRTLKRLRIVPTFILGEAEQERWGIKVVDALKDEFPWYLHMGLYELAEKLGRARMYLGNDSGVTHLAGAVGIPTVALFGPSDDQQWRPIGPGVRIKRAPAPQEKNLDALSEEAVLHEVLAELRKL
jgi:ADP-heptose:LPS heptosyltransferase